MKLFLFIIALILIATRAFAGNALHDACKHLCETDSECVRKCVAHSELMELRAEVVNAASDFHKKPELRLTALRTGANLEAFEVCRKSGWSTDNQLTCLRASPSPGLMKSCKLLSPREDDQVKCIRSGKVAGEVEACLKILVSADLRLQCVGLQLSVKATEACDLKGQGSKDRMRCLERAPRQQHRMPASVSREE